MSAKKKQSIASFEDGLEKLESIVKEMEEGELPLEKLITHYETGAELLSQCDTKLKEAERKIEVLKAKSTEKAEFGELEAED